MSLKQAVLPTKDAVVMDDGAGEPRQGFSLLTLAMAAVVGAGSGIICVGVRYVLRLLQWFITGYSGLLSDAAAHLPLWRRALTPVAGAVVATLLMRVSKRYSVGDRAVDYIEAVRLHGGRIPFRITVWRTLASVCSITSGATIGREGSMIQFAAASIAGLGVRLRGRWRLEELVSWGTSAAVASVYQAPLAGVFFTLEIVLGGRAISKASLARVPPLLIAAAVGMSMSHLFLGAGPIFPVKQAVSPGWQDCLPLVVSAVVIGSLGPVYFLAVQSLRAARRLPWAMVWGGAVVGLLSCIRTEVWGNGDSALLEVVSGAAPLATIAGVLLLRLVATAACVGSGVIGGVFTPTVFAGGVLGLLVGSAAQMVTSHTSGGHASAPMLFALVGMASLLGSVTRAPVTAALMTAELTGAWRVFPVVLLCSELAFQTARRLSPYSFYSVATPDPERKGYDTQMPAGRRKQGQ